MKLFFLVCCGLFECWGSLGGSVLLIGLYGFVAISDLNYLFRLRGLCCFWSACDLNLCVDDGVYYWGFWVGFGCCCNSSVVIGIGFLFYWVFFRFILYVWCGCLRCVIVWCCRVCSFVECGVFERRDQIGWGCI